MKLLPRIFRSKSNRRRLHLLRGMDARLNTELSALRTAEPSASGMAGTLDAVRATLPSHRDRKLVSRKRLLPRLCLGMMLALVGTVASYWSYIEQQPAMQAEFRDSGSYPNAHNIYTRLLPTVNLDKIGRLPHFDREGNREATIRGSSGSDKILPQYPQQISALRNEILKRNAQALQETRTALTLPYIYIYRSDASKETYEVRNFKQLWSLFMLEIDAARERKDDRQAALSALDALQFTMQLQCNTSIMPKALAMNWAIAVRDVLWDTLPKLDAPTLWQVVNRLDAIITLSNQARMDETLMAERIRGRKELLEELAKPGWRWSAANAFSPEETPYFTRLAAFLGGCRYSKRQIVANFEAMSLAQIDWSRQSYHDRGGEAKEFHANDPISKYFVSTYSGILFADTVSRSQNDLLLTAASIHLYKAEKSVYPASLLDLKDQEKHLKNRQHIDLFAIRDDAAPMLGYRREGNSFVLYSVGADTKDDGGSAIVNSPVAGAYPGVEEIKHDSKGDIVAGVNRSWTHR